MTCKTDIFISRKHDAWPDLEQQIRGAVLTTLQGQETEISIVLANNNFIQDLNKTYRGKDKPTNVLSFPQDEEDHLGDIILAFETIESEAKEQNKNFNHHVIHLVVHGVLHLMGHDHEEDQEAENMETLEIKILADLGIKNPYETSDSVR